MEKESNNIDTNHSYAFRILYFFMHPSFCDLCASKFPFHHQSKLSPLYSGILGGHKHITNYKVFYVCLRWKFSVVSYKSFGTGLKWKQDCIRNILTRCSPLFCVRKRDQSSILPFFLLCSVTQTRRFFYLLPIPLKL